MFEVSEGLPTCAGKFVIRFNGCIVRGEGALPLLFDTADAAKAEADQLQKAMDHG